MTSHQRGAASIVRRKQDLLLRSEAPGGTEISQGVSLRNDNVFARDCRAMDRGRQIALDNGKSGRNVMPLPE
jgi:hypothetical protein